MPTPTFPALGASTVHRKWCFEVNTGTTTAPVWKMIGATTNTGFNPSNATLQDDSDMQSGGAGSQTKTAENSTATITVSRKVKSDGISYDDAQEYLRLASINQFGSANRVQVRIYEFTPGGGPRVEAYMGFFAVSWDPQAEGNTGLTMVQITLTGQGLCAPITHPYPTTAVVPTITATTPATLAAAGGTLVHIFGASFTGVTGVTGVTFAGSNATNYSVENDGLIIATAPAHAAGTVALVVTNVTGSSASFNVTYV